MPTNCSASRATIHTSDAAPDPSAIRIPISRVRRVTEYASKPYNPTAASAIARPPNAARARDFSIADLVSHERPVSLYLVVPSSDKIRLRPLIHLMFTMVVNRLIERMAFEGTDLKLNKHRVLLLIYEFPSLNRMEIFADALSYMAGYGMKAYLITQDP